MKKVIASILIPTYNAEKFIRPAVESVIHQDFPKEDYEIIFVDDGSKDKTVEILNSYKPKFTNLKVFTQKNQGPSAGYTKLMQEAKGNYLCLMSHDCIAKEYWLKEVVKEFEKDPQVALVQGKLLPTKPIDLPVFHCNNFTSFQMTFDTAEVAYRASSVDKVGRFFRNDFSGNGHDADMAWRLIEAGFKHKWLDEVLMYHDVLPRKFSKDIKDFYLMQYFPKLLKLHPGIRDYLPYRILFASKFKYAFVLGTFVSIIFLGVGLPWHGVATFLFTILFSIFRILKATRDYNLSLTKKLFILTPHRIICESLLGLYLIYGSIRFRSLVI